MVCKINTEKLYNMNFAHKNALGLVDIFAIKVSSLVTYSPKETFWKLLSIVMK
jgi:hypothetical protein